MTSACAGIPTIRPVSDLRAKLNEVCEEAKTSREPIIMTKNGSPELVVLSPEVYEEERQMARYEVALRENAIVQELNGNKTYSWGETKNHAKEIIAIGETLAKQRSEIATIN